MEVPQKLVEVQRAANWSQERLARELGVSFATLNSWINSRSTPRKRAQASIERLYLDILGDPRPDAEATSEAKAQAENLGLLASQIIESPSKVDDLVLHLTYHTNTIEGSTMTLVDVSDVLFDSKVLSNRTMIEQAEARNHQAAVLWVLDQVAGSGTADVDGELRIDDTFICGLHLRLMNGILSDAGQYRRHPVRIAGSASIVANWQKVSQLLDDFVEANYGHGKDVIREMAESHARFEQIHPFSDGNGRVGRLILLVQALRRGLTPPIVSKDRKHAYYSYLELAQTKGCFEPLEKFIAECMVYTDSLLSPR